MSALSELIKAANTEDRSVDVVWQAMRDRGHKIGRDTVWKYMFGRHGRTVRNEYLIAFADVFPSLKLDDLQRAGEVPPDLGPWEPPEEVHALNQKERDALAVIIQSMARSKVKKPKIAELSDRRPTVRDLEGLPSAAEPLRRDRGNDGEDA